MTPPRRQPGLMLRSVIILACAAGGLAVFAWSRVGLLDLPSVPRDLELEQTGLADLEGMARLDAAIHASELTIDDWTPPRSPLQKPVSSLTPEQRAAQHDARNLTQAAQLVRQGLDLIAMKRPEDGLSVMRSGLMLDPDNLVLSNAYRMACFRLRRAALAEARRAVAGPVAAAGAVDAVFPAYLAGQPIGLLETLVEKHPSRQTRLALALAWVDDMLLFPALEIKAPASVESVRQLTAIIEGLRPDGQKVSEPSAYYVPALFARGLNHLHRPARLVWPEADKTPPDAAVQDIARCIAVGRKFDVGSSRLQATLAIALGDAYVKFGRSQNARSWWQIAQNLCRDEAIQQAVFRRYAWQDEDVLDRLEAELDRARAELDEPMTDLRLMWSRP
jgi:predicted RNA-binding protein YlxR (DUF448 family)